MIPDEYFNAGRVDRLVVNSFDFRNDEYREMPSFTNPMKPQFPPLAIAVLMVVAFMISTPLLAQQPDSLKQTSIFRGAITATNNGISLLPTFSLGKPAVIFDLAMGRRLTFEPQLRFAMEGKPWSFIFWWRYKVIAQSKFKLNVGAHPSLVFQTNTVILNGVTRDVMTSQRYLAAEIVPNYYLTKNTSIGIYYLQSHGFEPDATQNTYFFTVNANFSYIPISGDYFLRFNPQVFYLKMDNHDGYFYTATITAARKNFPLSVSSILNKRITSDIAASKDFIWNLSLVYSFSNTYVSR